MIFWFQYNVANFKWDNFKYILVVIEFEFQKTVKWQTILIYENSLHKLINAL